MITIDPHAAAYIQEKGTSLYLDLPRKITSCCFDFQECPSVRFGQPHNPEHYEERTINGIKILIPHALPEVPLLITLKKFLGIRRLVVEGWRYC